MVGGVYSWGFGDLPVQQEGKTLIKWSQGYISADFVSITDLGRWTLRGFFTGSSVSGWDISQVSCGLSEISHGERSAPQHPASFLGCFLPLHLCGPKDGFPPGKGGHRTGHLESTSSQLIGQDVSHGYTLLQGSLGNVVFIWQPWTLGFCRQVGD